MSRLTYLGMDTFLFNSEVRTPGWAPSGKEWIALIPQYPSV
jgi:hypothetical protein